MPKHSSVFDILPPPPARSSSAEPGSSVRVPKLTVAPSPEVTPSAPPPPVGFSCLTWAELDDETRPEVLKFIRGKVEAGHLAIAEVLILGLARGDAAQPEVLELADIDRQAAARGYLTHAEEARREDLLQEAIRVLGFDPRTEDGPSPAPTAVVLEPPEDLSRPVRDGDWEGLWKRVLANRLTEAQAVEIGQTWMQNGARRPAL